MYLTRPSRKMYSVASDTSFFILSPICIPLRKAELFKHCVPRSKLIVLDLVLGCRHFFPRIVRYIFALG